jgi:sugar lactone lactonase YvrE
MMMQLSGTVPVGWGAVEFKKPTNGANGLTREIQGRLVACEGAGRRLVREDGSLDDERNAGLNRLSMRAH